MSLASLRAWGAKCSHCTLHPWSSAWAGGSGRTLITGRTRNALVALISAGPLVSNGPGGPSCSLGSLVALIPARALIAGRAGVSRRSLRPLIALIAPRSLITGDALWSLGTG